MSHDCKERRDRCNKLELAFLERVSVRLPDDTEVMHALADLYTKNGRFHEGLEMDLELSRRDAKDPLVWYNLGCSFALTGQNDEAFEALTKAVEIGYADYDWMKQDSDLSSLRDDPRFESLLNWIYTVCNEDE